MKSVFIKDNFLLQSPQAERLYHEYAEQQPIVDYHCHLSPEYISKNINFRNLTHIWLAGDHYKWRAMRAMGVPEDLITGSASDRDKFFAWARTVPSTLKNPLYHWTHLELKRYFGIDELLDEASAPRIWDQVNEQLASPEYSTRALLRKMNVHIVCTTDDAIDELDFHKSLATESLETDPGFVLYPTFRLDYAIKIEHQETFRTYIKKLEKLTGIEIVGYASYVSALTKRHHYFDELGCRACDVGLEEAYVDTYTPDELESIVGKVLNDKPLTTGEIRKFKSAFLFDLATLGAKKGWAFQLHVGGIRNNNTRAFNEMGPDSGFDSIGDFQHARPLSRFLDRLDMHHLLPKTILYNLNSSDNEVFATLAGNFRNNGIPGKIQHGPAWWFHDQKEGMENQLQMLANMNLLSNFVGMVTDSRSFMSFPRHEYFRRLVCTMLGSDIINGIIPEDYPLIGNLIRKLCYKNAIDYFGYKKIPQYPLI